MGATLVTSVSQAMDSMKSLGDETLFWDESFARESREAVARVIHGRMQASVAGHLEWCASRGMPDRRNGSYQRRLTDKSGGLLIQVPRTCRYSPVALVGAYERRSPEVNRLIVDCFIRGQSTRKVGKTLLRLLGEPVSASTVSEVCKQLDAEVAAFHRRRLSDRYRVLMFDGVVLSRKTGAGAIKRPVLVALGVLPNGSKEVIDYRLAPGESQEAWEAFLNDLYRRGLTGNTAELAVSDGGNGLLAALPLVYPAVPVQRCWVHKLRNVLDKTRRADRLRVKRDLDRVMNAPTLTHARSAARRFADAWAAEYPRAVACLRGDLDALLEHHRFTDPDWRRAARSTNAIERCFVEVRRRTRPMGVMADRSSTDRVLYAVFSEINQNQGTSTPFPLTQNN
jgi:transposase-like protein